MQNTQTRRSVAGAAPSDSAHHQQSGGGGATGGAGDPDNGRHLPQLKVAQEKPAPVGKLLKSDANQLLVSMLNNYFITNTEKKAESTMDHLPTI